MNWYRIAIVLWKPLSWKWIYKQCHQPFPEATRPCFQVERAVLDVEFCSVLWIGGGRQRIAVLLGRHCTYCTYVSYYKLIVTDYKLVVTDYKLVVSDYKLVVSDYKLVVSDYKLRELYVLYLQSADNNNWLSENYITEI